MERIMKTRNGFTFVEAAVAMSIIGIMAAIAFPSFQKLVAQNTLQAATMNLFTELQATRATALKYDANVMVKFFTQQCSIYVDTSGNGSREPNEVLRVYTIPSGISIGIAASGGPSAAPSGIDWNSGGIAGNWNTPVMIVTNNALGSINSGAIYLKSEQLSKITYCIGISAAMRSLKLYKWGGASWIAL